MATVKEGNVVLFGAGGPVGGAAISALKRHYTLRVTDLRPMTEVAVTPPRKSPGADSGGVGATARKSGCRYYRLRASAGCLRGDGRGD